MTTDVDKMTDRQKPGRWQWWNEVLQLAEGYPAVHLAGRSKEDIRHLLENMKPCRIEFRELKIPENDEVLLSLINARRDLLPVLTASDVYKYANWMRASAAAHAQSGPLPASPPPSEQETGVIYLLAMRQLDCGIGRLQLPRLIDVTPGADIKLGILKDLLKVDVPNVRKSVDRARDALKTLTVMGQQQMPKNCSMRRAHARQLSAGSPWRKSKARGTAAPRCEAAAPGSGFRSLPARKRSENFNVLPQVWELVPGNDVSG
jgi:hypothetical protein